MKKIIAITILFIVAISTGCFTTTSVQTVPANVDVTVYTVIPVAPAPIVVTTGPGYVAQPGPKYIWIDGYWTWDYYRTTYVWIPGYWARTPYYHAVWVPGYWEYRPSGYVWVNPTWLNRGYNLPYGYCDGRYDYYGRPIYYPQPVYQPNSRGYSYSYDHRSQYIGREYSSYYEENNRGRTSGRTPATQPTHEQRTPGRTPATQPTHEQGTPGRTPATQPTHEQGTPGRTPATQPTHEQGTPGRTPATQHEQGNSRQNTQPENTGRRK